MSMSTMAVATFSGFSAPTRPAVLPLLLLLLLPARPLECRRAVAVSLRSSTSDAVSARAAYNWEISVSGGSGR